MDSNYYECNDNVRDYDSQYINKRKTNDYLYRKEYRVSVHQRLVYLICK